MLTPGAFLAAVLLFHAPRALAAFEIPERPQGRVSDFAGALSADQKRSLEAHYAAFERESRHQAAAAIFRSLEGESVEDLSARVFERWGIGSRERNDGVLLLLFLRERAARVEVGYGLEPDLPDAMAGRIIREELSPFLRRGEYYSALLVFEKKLESVFLRPGSRRGGELVYPGSRLAQLVIWLVAILAFLALVNSRVRRFTHLSRHGRYRSAWPLGTWGGGGGGLGGWSGGGGLSGGGGASGRW